VESYFAGMPQDTANGWSKLAGSMRSVGRAEYERFWGSIDSVDATEVTSAGPSAVDLVLTYHFSDGRVVRERQRLQLERSGDRYLIADDQVLSSQTISG
jgi:hypothetical protein